MRTAVALLTVRPHENQVQFLKAMATEHGYDLYVVADDNSVRYDPLPDVRVVQVSEELASELGYVNMSPLVIKPIMSSAWDKAVYFFTEVERSYDRVWFLEDDVLVTSGNALKLIDDANPSADLVCPPVSRMSPDGDRTEGGWIWWSCLPEELLPPPWAGGLVSAARFSRQLLDAVGNLVHSATYWRLNKPMLMIEYLFHTLALNHGFSIASPVELSGVTLHGHWDHTNVVVGRLYHPAKDLDAHDSLRAHLLGPVNGFSAAEADSPDEDPLGVIRGHHAAQRAAAIAEREAAIAEREAAIAERERVLAERATAQTERDLTAAQLAVAVAEREAALGEREIAELDRVALLAERERLERALVRTEQARLDTAEVLGRMTASRSWRWTAILRKRAP